MPSLHRLSWTGSSDMLFSTTWCSFFLKSLKFLWCLQRTFSSLARWCSMPLMTMTWLMILSTVNGNNSSTIMVVRLSLRVIAGSKIPSICPWNQPFDQKLNPISNAYLQTNKAQSLWYASSLKGWWYITKKPVIHLRTTSRCLISGTTQAKMFQPLVSS